MNEIENCLIEWVNVSIRSHQVTEFTDISNPRILLELMREISGDAFSHIEPPANNENWADNLRVLKQFLNAIDRYYETALGVNRELVVEDVNLSAIARQQSRKDILSLMELVIGAAIS